ncbi:DUF4326 domain-containing protein [soil metagenome]
MPERIQLSRAKGWRMPENTVNVSRPGKWGNPHRVWRDGGQWLVTSRGCSHQPVANQTEGIALAVAKFRADCLQALPFYGSATALLELRGKNLACWCKPGTPCHADVLLEVANEKAKP